MDHVLRYQIPVVHPFVIHFPIALVIVALVFVLVWIFRDRIFWMRNAIIVQVFGFIGAMAAYLTGEAMKEQSEGVPIVEDLVHAHEDAALIALILIGVSIVSLVGARLFSNRDTSHPGTRFWIRLVVGMIAVAAAVAVAWTAHIGGTMVWGVSA